MFRSSHPIPHYDVVIVGARCAGAATALLLARQDLRVLVVDRQAEGSDTLSTHALMRTAVLQLAKWGVLPDLLATGTPPIRRTVFHFGEQMLDIPIKPSHGIEALVAPRRTRLDALLVDHARRAGAEIHYETAFAYPLRRDDGRVFGAVLRGPDRAPALVHCDLLIGADGLRSPVAKAVGAKVLRQAPHSSAIVYSYWPSFDRDAYHWHYAPGSSVGVIPTDDGEACVFAAVHESRFLREFRGDVPGAYRRILGEAAPDALEGMHGQDTRLRAFWGSPGVMRQAHGPGWALVGDAGYFKDPMTSHGISDAFRDADLLAEAVAGGGEAALARYQEERDALSLDLFEVTERIASFEWDMDQIQRHLERLSTAMKAELAALATRLPVAMASSASAAA